jgi:acyl-CoA thioester hydrolase
MKESYVTIHQWQSKVRDYEADMYGGVNAATYMNYMEEARKWFLAQYGFNLKEMFDRDLGFVGTRYEIDYKLSLYPGDEFVIETSMVRMSRLQVKFTQHIYKLPDRKLAIDCTNYGLPITVSTNRPNWPVELDELLKDFPIQPKGQQ